MPYLNLSTAKLYYEDEGAGDETLVFGHSMLFNLRMFDDQVNFLKGNYRCVRFDFRGQGKSEITSNGYDLDSLTEDVNELIKALDCGPCHFVGFSMGGMIAMRLAIKYPIAIKSLILIDTSSEPEPASLRNKAMLLVGKYLGLKVLANQVMAMFFGADFLTDSKRKPIRETWKNYFLANDQIGILKVIKGVLSRKGITKRLYKISHPTIIMVGGKDMLTDIEKAEIMKKNIKNSTLTLIPRAGHMSPVEAPELINSSIQQFLLNLPYEKSV